MNKVKKISAYGVFVSASSSYILIDSSVMKTFGPGGNVAGYLIGSFVALANFLMVAREFNELTDSNQEKNTKSLNVPLEILSILIIASNAFSESLSAYTGLMASLPEMGGAGILVFSVAAAIQYLILTCGSVFDYFNIKSTVLNKAAKINFIPNRFKSFISAIISWMECVVSISVAFVLGYTGFIGMKNISLKLFLFLSVGHAVNVLNPIAWGVSGFLGVITMLVSGFAFYQTMLERKVQ